VNVELYQTNGGVAQWLAYLTRTWWMPVSCKFEPRQRLPLFPSARNITPHCLVLVGSKNGF